MAEGTSSVLASPATTLILVPGAWHTPSCYDLVIDHLKSTSSSSTSGATYNVVRVPLPSLSCSHTSVSVSSWQPDVDAVSHVLESEISKSANSREKENNNKTVLVISHSYGSLVANEALGLFISSYSSVDWKTNLRHLILCGFVLDAGSAIRDKDSTAPYPDLWDVKEDIVYSSADASNWFYHDLPEHEQQKYMKSLEGKYMPLASFTSHTRFAAWKVIPTTYLHCENDRTVPMAKQEGMISRARQAGGSIQTVKVASGHSPFLVVPQEVAGVIKRLTS